MKKNLLKRKKRIWPHKIHLLYLCHNKNKGYGVTPNY